MEEFYKVSITVGDRTVEIESHDKQWLEDKVTELRSYVDEQPPSPTTSTTAKDRSAASPIDHASLTVPEFYQRYMKPLKLKSRPDLALFFVYYLQRIAGQEEVKSADVTKCFSEIGYANYNNLNYADILASNRKKGLLNYVNNKWSLTHTGDDYVLNKISTLKANEAG